MGVYKKVLVIISSSLWNCGCRRKERRRKPQEFLKPFLNISKRVRFVFLSYLFLFFCFVLFEHSRFRCMKNLSSSWGPIWNLKSSQASSREPCMFSLPTICCFFYFVVLEHVFSIHEKLELKFGSNFRSMLELKFFFFFFSMFFAMFASVVELVSLLRIA